MNMCQAITNAIDVQMMRDESTIVFGEDVKFGGVFRCTVSPYFLRPLIERNNTKIDLNKACQQK